MREKKVLTLLLKLVLLIWTMSLGLIAPKPSESTSTSPITSTTSTTREEYVESGSLDAEFLAATNSQRTTPLKWSRELAAYAESKLATQADSLPLFHSRIEQLLGPWDKIGENLGTGPSVVAIQNALIASPSHYENMVDPEFTYFGSATKVGNNGSVWTVHIYGTPALESLS